MSDRHQINVEYRERDAGQQQEQHREHSEQQHSSYTHTEVKTNYPNLPAPFISTSAGLAKELVGEGFQASVSRIQGTSEEFDIHETPEMAEEARKDCEAKTKEQQMLSIHFEKELERKTEAYRKQQEVETEKIRKELEKQHLRDIEFRKELVEQSIENQKRQIDLEARYAKKELERERQKARIALEKSKFHTDISVNMDSTAAISNSGSQSVTISESEKITGNRN